MSAATSIQWTDRTWNPVRGCSRVSPGCDSCYAMSIAHRFSGPGRPYEGLTRIGKRGVDWAGSARLIPKALAEPLHWRKPRRIFVNSMSDLFHESLTNEEIAAVFGVMAACPQHTFQVLTKRAKRMREWFEWAASQVGPLGYVEPPDLTCQRHAYKLLGERFPLHAIKGTFKSRPWPLTWVWLGVSAEDQQRADERIPDLIETPAAIRFVSVEPQIGPVRLDHVAKLDWVIQGGESGRNARPFDVDWARSLRDECREAGAAYFLKQLGANVRDRNDAGFLGEDGDAWDIACLDDVEHDPDGIRNDYQGAPVRVRLRDSHGGDWDEWPLDLRVREFPAVKP